MLQRISQYGIMRVNKIRAKAMYNHGYPVRLTMCISNLLTSEESTMEIRLQTHGDNFNHIVSDFYELHKGERYSYTVEYWVSENDNHEYLYYRQKPYNDRYKAKKRH